MQGHSATLVFLLSAAFFLALPEAASAQIWVSSQFTVAPDGNREMATCSTSAAEPNNPAQPPSAAAADYNQFLAYCTVTPSSGAVITSSQCPSGNKAATGNPAGQCSVTFQPQPNITYTVNSSHYVSFIVEPWGTDCGEISPFEFYPCYSDPLGYYSINPNASSPWPPMPTYPTDTASIAENETCAARGGTCTPQIIPSYYCPSVLTIFGFSICNGNYYIAPPIWPLARTSAVYSCNLPTKETTAFDGWDTADSLPSVGLWKQTVSDPGGDSFFGFEVQETDAGGAVDGCWFPNPDGVLPTTTVTGGEWMVQDGNTWGDDLVGSQPIAVAYYRAHNRVPCTITVHQQMQMRCSDDAWHNYGSVNTLQSIITATTVTSVRAGGTATRRY